MPRVVVGEMPLRQLAHSPLCGALNPPQRPPRIWSGNFNLVLRPAKLIARPSDTTPALHPPSSSPSTMASQRLALSLKQGLRTRAALRSIQPLTRSFATPVSHGAKTECTTLSNGFTVSAGLTVVGMPYLPDCRLPQSTPRGLRPPPSVYG